jgi:hypothetical protein
MPKRKAKPDSHYADQPAVAAILKMLENRRGATVAEIAKARGLLQLHTVRSVLSRLGSKAGLELTRTRVEGRGGLCIAPRPRRPPLNLEATQGSGGLRERLLSALRLIPVVILWYRR